MKVPVKELKKRIDPDTLAIKSTEETEELSGIIGQERAVRALKFGLNIRGKGYNTYVAGPSGIGKMTSVQSFLEEIAKKRTTPPDWCYVYNFDDPYEPVSIKLPPGKATTLQEGMDALIDHIKQDLPQAFENENYANRREEKLKGLSQSREEVSRQLNERAKEKGFQLQFTPMGIVMVPVKDGKPLSDQEVSNLSQEEQEEIQEKRRELQKEVRDIRKRIRKLEKEEQGAIKDLDRQVALHTIGGRIEDIKEEFQDFEEIQSYLNAVQKDILENLQTFRLQQEAGGQGGMQGAAQQQQIEKIQEQAFKRYRVNVLIDNGKQKGAPVIVELNPNYNNLIGRIEKEMQMGAVSTDFSLIKAGALLRANGGFLVIQVEDLLKNFFSWEALKRALRGEEIRIEEIGEQLGYLTLKTLRPQPIPLDVKVVIVGMPWIYHLLYAYEPDFPELFKIKADFDTKMDDEEEDRNRFIQFIGTFCRKEGLKHCDNKAVARLLEHATRVAENKGKISTNFGNIADMIRESNYWAEQDNAGMITDTYVQRALDERIFRSNLLEEKIQELIEDGTILIDTDGAVSGQVNALSIMDLGDYLFGRPSRVTATVTAGREGIVDLEREAKTGGPIHSKGVLILSGYIAGKYAHDKPLTLAAKLVFEQSYQGVEGDSASQAELYAVLSALAELPLKQSIAVTGSVNQQGVVQAVGGINHKIEGFFKVCKIIGLTGDQGVIIPKSNVRHLMLNDEVCKAVDDGKFSIYSVETIDEGIEILTGLSAGELKDDGTFPDDSVNGKVRKRLEQFSSNLAALRGLGEKEED